MKKMIRTLKKYIRGLRVKDDGFLTLKAVDELRMLGLDTRFHKPVKLKTY